MFDYDNKYLSLNQDWHLEDAPRKFYEITQVLPLGDYTHMLDVGCGIGALTRLVANYYKCKNVTGLDVSKIAIEKAVSLDTFGQTSWVKGDIFDLPDEKAYDVVLCIDILEHLENIPAFLKKVKRLAKLVVIRIPIEQTLLNSFMKALSLKDEYKRLEEKYGHINHLTPVAVKSLLEQQGFEVLNYKAFPMPPRTSPLLDFFRWVEHLTITSTPDLTLRLFGGFLVLLTRTHYGNGS